MKKLQTVLLGVLTAAALVGRAFADVIPLSEMELAETHTDPLIIVLIILVIVAAGLIVAKAIHTSRKRRKENSRDERD